MSRWWQLALRDAYIWAMLNQLEVKLFIDSRNKWCNFWRNRSTLRAPSNVKLGHLHFAILLLIDGADVAARFRIVKRGHQNIVFIVINYLVVSVLLVVTGDFNPRGWSCIATGTCGIVESIADSVWPLTKEAIILVVPRVSRLHMEVF